MKNTILLVIFALFTLTAMAQEKPEPNTGTEEKANHNTSRSNKTPGGIAVLNTDSEEEDQTGIFEKRKCIKSGGTFYEHANGRTRCLPGISIKDKTQYIQTEEAESGISKRKKCLKAGNVWITNSQGSMCLEKLNSKN